MRGNWALLRRIHIGGGKSIGDGDRDGRGGTGGVVVKMSCGGKVWRVKSEVGAMLAEIR